MTSRELFQKDETLRKLLAEVVKSDWFSRCLIYAKGEWISGGTVTKEQIAGVKDFLDTLQTLCDGAATPRAPLETGLIHDLEPVKPIDKKKE